MSGPVLEVSGLHAGYGGGDILQGVEMNASKGEIVAAVGRNGVGKTTLMKTVMGLLPRRQGTISFLGEPIEALPAEDRARRGLGYVPQGKQIFPQLTVEENLRMGERINGGRHIDHALVLDFFPRLRDRLKQKGGTLSGGEQQALAIGRALVAQPALLLLDEPSESIQPNIVVEIGETLNRLNEQLGLTIIIVEQNLGLIERVAQRGYVIDKGRVLARLDRAAIRDRATMVRYLSV